MLENDEELRKNLQQYIEVLFEEASAVDKYNKIGESAKGN